MYRQPTDDVRRPLIEFDQLRWQRLKGADGFVHRRMLWRRQDPKERENEATRGLAVLKEHRILPGIGREFIPPLDEGSFLYMPSLLPQAGLGPAIEVNSIQDRAIASVPEVESVVGKLGRAESALDPAPIGMMESIIILKPESEWRHVPVKRVFSTWPGRAADVPATHSDPPCHAPNRLPRHDGRQDLWQRLKGD
jgi:Cu(I)/Ag(I) efflux system membrane protein CusA/SilA